MEPTSDGKGYSHADERSPSREADDFWIFAHRRVPGYPERTTKGGKWLVFVPIAQIDEVWATIKVATERGLLGGSSKVATARPNRNVADPGKRVICVYTYDQSDRPDVDRVRQGLRDLGVSHAITWKADEDTRAGRYSNRGDRGIGRYRA